MTVRETVPDSVFASAATKSNWWTWRPTTFSNGCGKEKSTCRRRPAQAIEHFFRKGNLIALRELALRKVAERVNAQMASYRHKHRIEETWPVSERLLVCVSPSPMSRRLVRATRRLASSLRTPWVAAHVETPRDLRMSASDRERLNQTLELAAQLDGETATLTGQNVAEELVRLPTIGMSLESSSASRFNQSGGNGCGLAGLRAYTPLRRHRCVRD